MADPMDSLVASAAMVLQLQLDASGALDDGFGAMERSVFELLGRHSSHKEATTSKMLNAMEQALDMDQHLPGRAASGTAYVALTSLGSPAFLDTLSLSQIVPLERYPEWFHARQVLPAAAGKADVLQSELRSRLPDTDDIHWQTMVRGDRVVVDFAIALRPDREDADPHAVFALVGTPGQRSGRSNSAARTRFARSKAPVALHIDYRRMGQLLAIGEAASSFDRFAEDAARNSDFRLRLITPWVRANQRTAAAYQSLNDIGATYADATVELYSRDEAPAIKVVSTRAEDRRATPTEDHFPCDLQPPKEGQHSLWESLPPALRDACDLPVVIGGLFDARADHFQREVSPRGGYTVLRTNPEWFDARARQKESESLPEVLVVVDWLPACVFDVRKFATRSLGDIQRLTPRDGRGALDRRVLAAIEQARRCESHHPQLPQLSIVVSRNLWQLGLQEQRAGRLGAAVALYQESCAMSDELACDYLAGLERATNVALPEVQQELNPRRPQGRFGDFVHAYISVDDEHRLFVGDQSMGTLQELGDATRREQIRQQIHRTPLPTPLALVSADSRTRDQARGTLALAAPGEVDAALLLQPWTGSPLESRTTIRPLIETKSQPGRQLAWSTLKLRSTWLTPAGEQAPDSDTIRVHLRADGIDVVENGISMPAVDDCAKKGPTICVSDDRETVEGYPFDELYSVLPKSRVWRQGRGELFVVVEDGISWGLLATMTILMQNPNHPQWRGTQRGRLLWFSSRIAEPYRHLTVVMPAGAMEP